MGWWRRGDRRRGRRSDKERAKEKSAANAAAKCATILAAERLTSAQKPEQFLVTGPRAEAAMPAMKDAHRPH